MARFRSAERRQGWLLFVAAGLFDFALVWLAAVYFAPDSALPTAAIFYLGLVALGIIMAIKSAIWTAIVGKFGGANLLAHRIAAHLQSQEFPQPNDDEDSPGAYFMRVSESEAVPMHVRLQAAREHGSFDAHRGIAAGMLWAVVYEKALKMLPLAPWQGHDSTR